MTRIQQATTTLRRALVRTDDGQKQDLFLLMLAENPVFIDDLKERFPGGQLKGIHVRCVLEGLACETNQVWRLTPKGEEEIKQILG